MQQSLQEKEATFKVTVKGVRSSFLPELSDEVVQKISHSARPLQSLRRL